MDRPPWAQRKEKSNWCIKYVIWHHQQAQIEKKISFDFTAFPLILLYQMFQAVILKGNCCAHQHVCHIKSDFIKTPQKKKGKESGNREFAVIKDIFNTFLWIRVDCSIIVPRSIDPVQAGQPWGGVLLFSSVVHTVGPHTVWVAAKTQVSIRHEHICADKTERYKYSKSKHFFFYKTIRKKVHNA